MCCMSARNERNWIRKCVHRLSCPAHFSSTIVGTVVDEEGRSFLHLCAQDGGTYDLCIELVKIGIPLQAQDNQGNSALHLAAKAGNIEVAKALVAAGAQVNARNKNNRTPKMVVRLSKKHVA